MHCVCLVYSHSTFYNTPARVIVLMQETCNLLIDSGRKYMDPTSLFQVNFKKKSNKQVVEHHALTFDWESHM